MLAGVDEMLLFRDLTHFGLVHGPQRQAHMGQLLLGQVIEHIALILTLVQPLFQQPAAGGLVLLHPGVMARATYSMPWLSAQRNKWSNFIYRLQSMQGLGVPPISYTRMNFSMIFSRKSADEIQYLIGDIHRKGHLGGILDILFGAAGVETGLPSVSCG